MSSFSRYTISVITKRIRSAVAPDFAWPAMLILGNGRGEYYVEDVADEQFANNDRFNEFLTQVVPQTIEEAGARQAAFVKPVWVGYNGERELLKGGVLVISAEPRRLQGWGAYIIRRPDVEPHLGGAYEYVWNDDQFDRDVNAAFSAILDPNARTREVTGPEEPQDD